MRISVLPDHVINQIAAGEVVDRPASVVRELVDNALDAGAKTISIYVSEGGQASIRVVDDGCGMGSEDALLAFQRHATSKLREASDLFRVKSLGFRGEALPAIAAVSKTRIRTRRSEDALAVQVSVEAGRCGDSTAIPGPVGTEVEVSGLFFNTPARRKFLKSIRSEEQRIKQWVLDSSFSFPEVHYRLFFGTEEVLNLPRRTSFHERARAYCKGSNVAVDYKADLIQVRGVIAHPAQAQFHSQALVVLVNNRLVQDRMVARAVKDGFGNTLKDREYPLGVISIELDPAEVDVNVHPQKSEVRFRSPQGIFGFVRTAVQDAVREFKGVATIPEFTAVRKIASDEGSSPQAMQVEEKGLQSNFSFSVSRVPSEARFATQALSSSPRFSDLKYIGQLLECYLLCECNEKFFVVDMHAAHERHRFNVIRNVLLGRATGGLENRLPSQRLLLSCEFQAPGESLNNLSSIMHYLEQLGFEIEIGNSGSICMKAVPALLGRTDPLELLKELCGLSMEAEEGLGTKALLERKFEAIAARLACHSSIRSGKKLHEDEVYALFELLDSAECSAACPHGRPVMVSFSLSQVEQWFGRDR